jgi:hypothetical protein
VVGAERVAASVAVELVAAGTQQFAADGIGAGVDFQECVPAVFVVLDRKALEESIAGGAGDRSESVLHRFIIAILRKIVKRNLRGLFYAC